MELISFFALGGIIVVILLMLFLFKQIVALKSELSSKEEQALLHQIGARVTDVAQQAGQRETSMREEFRANREETAKSVSSLGETVRKIGVDQTAQQTQFRDEVGDALKYLNETVRKLGADQSNQQQQFRDKLDEKMRELRTENSQKLDEMRKTVDEKLQTTLEKRLSESFKTVSERLEAVQQGLGEMKTLAVGVGDLKRVLSNVKSRGGFGEKELQMLIEDFLTPEQFILNYDCGKKTGGERVEFGVRVPGAGGEVYLPVDAKFPKEDYDRLLDAYETNDANGIKTARVNLERAMLREAKSISTKYINPPSTTDWAVLFLPTEGLYAEAIRLPGLFERLQREFHVTIAGPTNVQVLLSTFRMGFRQLALQNSANEVWDVLSTVKSEFNKFGSEVDKIGKQLNSALNQTEEIQKRKRVMLRALKKVEEVDDQSATELLEE